jgi:methylenetetrahydrofolate dehydrogenase (NADP+)/methenyltetrahydrofolate cyclohydrolase
VTEIVSGKLLSAEILSDVTKRVSQYQSGKPCLCVVLVGEDPASQVYVRKKDEAARQCGIESRQIRLPATTTEAELLRLVAELNRDPGVHSLLVQLPLPNGIDPAKVALALDPAKDVDGLHPISAGRLLANKPGFAGCTPLGCIYILDHHKIPIEGAHAVVIGRSSIVGKPVALLLQQAHATVTMCHSRTRNLAELCRMADVLVAAVGVPRLVRRDWVKPGAAVVDVGVSEVEGALVGDVDTEGVIGVASLVTPHRRGVGPMTITMLLRNTLSAYESRLPA